MADTSTLLLFALASLGLLVVPGPAVLYIVTTSVDGGRPAGLLSVLGVQTGGLVHVAAAALGLSALLASSALAYDTVRYAGAAYLIVIGIRKLLAPPVADAATEPRPPRSLWRVYWQGVLVNVLNPKTALFFLAFLPQFVRPDGAPIAMQVAVLGVGFVALATISDGSYALAASAIGRRLSRSARAQRRTGRVSGGVYVGLGLLAATTGRRAA